MMDLGAGASGGRRSDTATGGGVWPSSSHSQRLKTGKGVREKGVPPPFLVRTFSMVNDPNTNSIISWSPSGTSFIVWDHLHFSSELLPKYFKHSNFSSFIYQLNNYGFRKIGVEHQWEYENQYFQAGKEHLLIEILRRNQKHDTLNRQKRTRKPSLLLNKYETELVLGNLRNGISETKLEIQKLKQKQEDIETQIVTFKEHIEHAQNKSQKLLSSFAKALDEFFVKSLSKEIDLNINETRKKPKMIAAPENTDDALEAVNASSVQDHEIDLTKEAKVKESGDYKFWKELLEEDDENGAREETVNIKQQTKIALELENLFTTLPHQEDTIKP